MEEKFKFKDNKVFIGSIVGVLVLIILTVGATYAYFTFNADNQFGSQSINASTEAIGSGVVLTKVGDGLTLDVSASEMLEENIGTNYYASGSEEPATIGKITVTGEGTYNCSYTMKVTATSTSEDKNLYTKFQSFANKSEGQIYLSINETRYDFNTSNLFPITYQGSVSGITSASDSYITANMTIANTDIDQTVLNDADISIQFEVTQFDCELYETEPIGTYLLENPTTGLNISTSYNGMYRYIGTASDNYVKLSDGTNEVLYRIIGITSDANSRLGLEVGQLKLIKAESIGKYSWHSDDMLDASWIDSDMFYYLQSSSVLGNTSIIPSGWSDRIDSTKWTVGDVDAYSDANAIVDAITIAGYEATSLTSTSKIGLMYLSDYYYAYNVGGTQNCYYDDCSSWMTDTSATQWTMSRYGYNPTHGEGLELYVAWAIGNGGGIFEDSLVGNYKVRPVFYLNPDVQYVSGTGTESDPFILE